MATPYSTAGLPGLQSGVNTSSLPNLNNSYASQTKAVQDAMYARMAPQLGQNRHAAETRLLNSGIEKGTQAWDAAQQNLGQNENDANMQAVLAGSQEQSRLAGLERGARGQLFGEGATNATFGNQARGQGMQEQSYLRQVPLNELNALRTGSQVTGPSFSGYYTGGNAAGVQSYQAGQDGYNAQVGNVNAQNAANGQLVGAAAGLGGAAISAGALSSLAGGAMLAF